MADAELMGPLRALAHLLPTAAGIQSEHLNAVISQLPEADKEAVQRFCDAGDICIEKLSGDTLVALQRVVSGTRAVARGRRDIVETDDGLKQSVYELMEKYDSSKTGVLSRTEFQSAAKTLMGEMTVEELDRMANEVDRNKDGSVDIHEFTVWLYGVTAAEVSNATPESKVKPEVAANDDTADVVQLKKKLEAIKAELDAKTRAITKIEERHETEMDASLDFWRGIAKNSIHTIDKKLDLDKHEWLGNGKFGFVLKANRRVDNREVVVKMMGLRWAHLAVKEFQFGSTIGKCPMIVDYDDVMLHNDDDKSFEKLLQEGYESGKLKSRTKRSKFPDRYVCLTQELMNRGVVQDWMDEDNLLPGGTLCVMKAVAEALAFMHQKGVTHNDIKPENVMCHQDDIDKEGSPVTVKLGDLGCCLSSSDTDADYWQYGMTVFCMMTGTKFGSRKYRKESEAEFCQETAAALETPKIEGKLGEALSKVPDIMKRIFPKELTMGELCKDAALEGWTFFDGAEAGAEGAGGAEAEAQAAECPKRRGQKKMDSSKMKECTKKHQLHNMGGDE